MWFLPLSHVLLLSIASSCPPILPRNTQQSSAYVAQTPQTTTLTTPELTDYQDVGQPSGEVNILASKTTSSRSKANISRPIMAVNRDQSFASAEHSSRLLPSLFDLFRPLNLHNLIPAPFRSSTPEKKVENPKFALLVSPPLSWTYCEPLCGIGDQAVDAENAYDNANDDVKNAFVAAYIRVGIQAPTNNEITVEYDPKSTMIDEFGDFFDRLDYRYQLRGSSVAYKVQRNATNETISHTVKLNVRVNNNQSIRWIDAERILYEGRQALSKIGARFGKPIEIIGA